MQIKRLLDDREVFADDNDCSMLRDAPMRLQSILVVS